MQRRRGHFTFLYMPDDQSRTREVRVPRWALLAAALGLITIAVLAGGFLAGYGERAAAARLRAENGDLRGQIDRLEQKVALLRADLDTSYHLQETVAAAVGVRALDPTAREAGVGGRSAAVVPSAAGLPPAQQTRLASLDLSLDKLLRQAKLQSQGYESILDTLRARASARDRIPSIKPVDGGWVSSGFGSRVDPFTGKPTVHEGVDFSVGVGTPVHATADGVVREVTFERGFGHVIVIQHDGRTATRYAHLARPMVTAGSVVKRGDVIALSGASGRVTSPHLHYEVLLNGRPVNPLPYVLENYAWRR